MGDEQLSTFQEANLKWLKRQVDNLQDEQHRADARPRVKQELWAAREELDNYVKTLRDHGIKILRYRTGKNTKSSTAGVGRNRLSRIKKKTRG